jgi:hypothetical protein
MIPLDDVKLENVRAMIEAAREYGIYHHEKVNLHREYTITREVK